MYMIMYVCMYVIYIWVRVRPLHSLVNHTNLRRWQFSEQCLLKDKVMN